MYKVKKSISPQKSFEERRGPSLDLSSLTFRTAWKPVETRLERFPDELVQSDQFHLFLLCHQELFLRDGWTPGPVPELSDGVAIAVLTIVHLKNRNSF